MIRFVSLIAAMLLVGCAATADLMNAAAGVGQIKTSTATFDESTTVEATPSFTYANQGLKTNSIKLGALWNSSAPDEILLISSYDSSTGNSVLYISLDKIEVRIGEEFFTLHPIGSTQLDNSTYNDVSQRIYTRSERAVVAPMELFERMLVADDVRMRIHSSKGYEDSFFNIERIPGGQATAKVAFKKMLVEIDKYR